MQTFLPYPNFKKTSECLDMRRLGKQRVECFQILKALKGQTSSWSSHPASKMWLNYENALVKYGLTICEEWKARGYKDTCYDKIRAFYDGSEIVYPPWLGNASFHASHRSNLLRKDSEWYSKFGWSEPDNLEYVWPVR